MGEIIILSETSPDYRKGFMFAMRAIADMGLSDAYPTKEDFLKQINDIIYLHDIGAFFPNKEVKNENK